MLVIYFLTATLNETPKLNNPHFMIIVSVGQVFQSIIQHYNLKYKHWDQINYFHKFAKQKSHHISSVNYFNPLPQLHNAHHYLLLNVLLPHSINILLLAMLGNFDECIITNSSSPYIVL